MMTRSLSEYLCMYEGLYFRQSVQWMSVGEIGKWPTMDIYRLLNEYNVLGPSSLVGIWSPSLRGDHSDQRTNYYIPSSVITPTKERIIIYLYKIINLIKISFFIPRHRIDRHSIPLHARIVVLKLQSGHCDQQSCNKQACNKQ